MTISHINHSIAPQKKQLLEHTLYHSIDTIEDLHCFLEMHVYAVWDFMSLLKALQAKLTCTFTPWVPVGNPETRYLINEIVLAEETDTAKDGSRKSHYEMYLEAMETCGADTQAVKNFLEKVEKTQNIFVSIKQSELHPSVKNFLDFTFSIIDRGEVHEIAAAFTFGRENLIPEMFTQILNKFQNRFPDTDLSNLIYYFERHIELDGDEHGPMAMKMISELCGDNQKKWLEVERVSQEALEKRITLWNAIEQEIKEIKHFSSL